jgi:hypothetical protein
MSLHSQENMRRILDELIERPSIARATRKILGSNSKILYVWCRDAARDRENGVTDSKYIVQDWPAEGDATWFDKGVKQTRVMHALNLDSDERDTLSHSERHVVEGGKICWTPNPVIAAHALSMDDFEWEFFYGNRPRSDIWQRDQNGGLIPLMVKQEQPAQIRIHALRALLADLWNPPERREVDTKLSGGVYVIGQQKREQQDSPLAADLRQRLADLRAKGPAHPKPNAPVEIMGRGESGPRENISQPSSEAPPNLHDHPRAYTQPQPQPPQQPPTDYARRPTKALNAEDRRGAMPSGGFSTTTGRPT